MFFFLVSPGECGPLEQCVHLRRGEDDDCLQADAEGRGQPWYTYYYLRLCFIIQRFVSAILEAKLNSVPEIAQAGTGTSSTSDPATINSENLQTGEHPPPQHHPVSNGETNKVEITDNEVAVAPG